MVLDIQKFLNVKNPQLTINFFSHGPDYTFIHAFTHKGSFALLVIRVDHIPPIHPPLLPLLPSDYSPTLLHYRLCFPLHTHLKSKLRKCDVSLSLNMAIYVYSHFPENGTSVHSSLWLNKTWLCPFIHFLTPTLQRTQIAQLIHRLIRQTDRSPKLSTKVQYEHMKNNMNIQKNAQCP